MRTLHLMTQRDQPYGSVRKCCERCGIMLMYRPDEFWSSHAYTDQPEDWKDWKDYPISGTETEEFKMCSVLTKSVNDKDLSKDPM